MYLKILITLIVKKLLLPYKALLYIKCLLLKKSKILRKIFRISILNKAKEFGMGSLYFIESVDNVNYYTYDCELPIIALLISSNKSKLFANYMKNCVYLYIISVYADIIKYSKDTLIIEQYSTRREHSVKLDRKNIYDILKQIDLSNNKTNNNWISIKVGSRTIVIRSSIISLSFNDYQIMKKHSIGRIMNIHEWPREAIELWANYCLELDKSLLNSALKKRNKKELVNTIQKYFIYQIKNKVDFSKSAEQPSLAAEYINVTTADGGNIVVSIDNRKLEWDGNMFYFDGTAINANSFADYAKLRDCIIRNTNNDDNIPF